MKKLNTFTTWFTIFILASIVSSVSSFITISFLPLLALGAGTNPTTQVEVTIVVSLVIGLLIIPIVSFSFGSFLFLRFEQPMTRIKKIATFFWIPILFTLVGAMFAGKNLIILLAIILISLIVFFFLVHKK